MEKFHSSWKRGSVETKLGGDAERQAKWIASRVTGLGGEQEVVPGPRVRELGRLLAGGIHGQKCRCQRGS